MKTLGHLLNEAKATYCGRCGTRHVPPSKGGTCPALKEEQIDEMDKMKGSRRSYDSVRGEDKTAKPIKQGEMSDDALAGLEDELMSQRQGKSGEDWRARKKSKSKKIDEGRTMAVANRTADVAGIATGTSSGDIAAPAAVEAGARRGQAVAARRGMTRTATNLGRVATGARFVGQADTMNALGSTAARAATRAAPRVAASGLGRVATGVLGKAAWPVALGFAAYDAYKGYNAQPNASTGTRLRNAGQNALSGLTFGAVPAPRGVNESTGHGKMKPLTQFMAEANEHRYVEEELSPEMQAIFDAINEAVGDRELSEEEFTEIFNYVVENLESAEEVLDEDQDLVEAHDIELKPHPKKPGTHYVVHKVNDKSIGSDQLKVGETLNDTHVDDLKDMGYKVKIHKENSLNESKKKFADLSHDEKEDHVDKLIDKAYQQQYNMIEKKHGKSTAKDANYGRGESGDEDHTSLNTKVYGHGHLNTHIDHHTGEINHEWSD